MVPKERHHWTDTFGREWPGLLRPSSWPLSPQKSTPTLISHKHLHWSLSQGQAGVTSHKHTLFCMNNTTNMDTWYPFPMQLQPPSPRKTPRTQTRTRPRSQDRFATRDKHARGLSGLGAREWQQELTTLLDLSQLGTTDSNPPTNDDREVGWPIRCLVQLQNVWRKSYACSAEPHLSKIKKNASCHLTPAISICSSLSLVVLPNLSNWPVFGSSSHDSLIKHLIWTLFSKFTGA